MGTTTVVSSHAVPVGHASGRTSRTARHVAVAVTIQLAAIGLLMALSIVLAPGWAAPSNPGPMPQPLPQPSAAAGIDR